MNKHTQLVPSITRSWNYSSEVFKKKWAFLYLLTIGTFILTMFLNYLPTMLSLEKDALVQIAMFFVRIGVGCVVGMGTMYLNLKVIRGEDAKFGQIFEPASMVLSYIWLVVRMICIIVFGYFLLIVPGVVWSIKYLFAPFYLIDKRSTVSEALKASAQMTKDIKFDIFLFTLGLSIINLLGMMFFVVGLFITVPVTLLMQYHLYDSLLEKVEK